MAVLFEGAGVAIVTPFHQDGTLNLPKFGELIEEQIREGTDAIVVCGTTGETPTLSADEHSLLVVEAVKVSNGRVPIIAGTGTNSTAKAIDTSIKAEKLGADGLLLVSPYYNKGTQQGLIKHFTAIANSVSIPVLLYNVPGRTGINILPETIAYLVKHVENIVGVKDATEDLSALVKLMRLCQDIDIDVYSGKVDVENNIINIALYLVFFPKLIAGPIVKSSHMLGQIHRRKTSWDDVTMGICRVCEGLFKKVLIANNMAAIADTLFNLTKDGDPTVKLPVLLAWLGAFSYLLQLYYDLSSYADIAIGLAKMFGFELMENFNYPLMSKSIIDFMRRWNISVISWFHKYVYKILYIRAERRREDRTIGILFVLWFFIGIWHGASLNYAWWGLYIAVFIFAEMIWEFDRFEGYKIARHVYVVLVMTLSMVIFRSNTGSQLALYFGYMFGLQHAGIYNAQLIMFIREYWMVLVTAILFLFPIKKYIWEYIKRIDNSMVYHCIGVCYVLIMPIVLIFTLAVMSKGGYHPFITFNF